MTKYMDYSGPNVQFTYDVNRNTIVRKDSRNYINQLSVSELNTLDNTSLLDIFLSAGNIIEPHYHQNAAELVYCVSGAAVVSILNPFTKQLLHFPITPGQVANVPQGWWHYEIATVDQTHLLAIFNAPTPEVILGSDLLRLTPADIWAYTYCLQEAQVKQTLAPIKQSLFIGPPSGCRSQPAPIPPKAARQEAPNGMNGYISSGPTHRGSGPIRYAGSPSAAGQPQPYRPPFQTGGR